MKTRESAFSAMNLITGIAGILFGIIVGYIMGATQVQTTVVSAAAATSSESPHAHVPNEAQLQAYKDILKADPKNAKAATELANALYDAGRFNDAVPYYQQALANGEKSPNVSTDLATALYYAGQTDAAIAQLEQSLKLDRTHAQTWFNLGIIRRDGKKDKKGAVDAWQKLLDLNPGYPEAERVKALIAETK